MFFYTLTLFFFCLSDSVEQISRYRLIVRFFFFNRRTTIVIFAISEEKRSKGFWWDRVIIENIRTNEV